MSSTNVKDSNPTENPGHSSRLVITAELVYSIIMTLKGEFLRDILLFLLENNRDQLSLVALFLRSIKLLERQKKEEDEFNEKLKKGDVTLGEIIEFRESQVHADYCLICLEKINKDSKICQCASCMFVFHEECFRKQNTDGICEECKKISAISGK